MKFPEPLKEDIQEKLLKAYKETGDKEIKDKMVLTNQRLVFWFAKKYYKEGKNELEDLFQQGIIGLMKAIEDYDSNKGSFGGYAGMCIKGSIYRDMANYERAIRIPAHMIEEINQLILTKKELINILGREPTIKEISIDLDLDIKKVEHVLKIINTPISLNSFVVGEEGELTLQDTIIDENSMFEDVLLGDIFIDQMISEFSTKLTEQELNIIILSYCINGQEYTAKQIGEHYNMTPEQVFDKRKKALRIMRTSKFMNDIRKQVEEETSYYRSTDYSQPRSFGGGGLPSSPVERIVLDRERRTEKLLKIKGEINNE